MSTQKLIVYDGQCLLCNRFIQFVLKKDTRAHFIFSSYQGLPSHIEQKGLKVAKGESILYRRFGVWHQKSTAVLWIYRDLFGALHYSQLAWIVPRFLRDVFYEFIARNRYKWFGKNDSCIMPSPTFKKRFIG